MNGKPDPREGRETRGHSYPTPDKCDLRSVFYSGLQKRDLSLFLSRETGKLSLYSAKRYTKWDLEKAISEEQVTIAKRLGYTRQSHIADLYQRYAPELQQYIRRHVPSQEDAEDVLLEVFIAALEKPDLSEINEQKQLAWLRRVAHNKFVDFHRRNVRRPAIPLQDAQYELYDEDEHAPEVVALDHEQHALLHSHVASLPQIQQEVLRLRFAEDLHCPEIAQRLDKSDGAIRTMLSRVLQLLRNIYINSEEERSNG